MEIGKIKVTFYLSSGQKMVVKCKKFDMTKLSGTKGNRKIDIKGADMAWTIDVDEIVGTTAKWVLF